MSRTEVPAEFRSTGAKMASEAQVKWIRDMLRSKNLLAIPSVFDAVNAMDVEEYGAYVLHLIDEVSIERTTMARARGLIDTLKPLAPRTDAIPALDGSSERPPAVDVMRGRTRVVFEEIATDAGTRRVGRIVLPDGQKVMAGSYGLDTSDDDRFTNDMSFFKVWVGDRGGWSVQLYVSDDTTRVKLAFPTQLDMLKRIAPDQEAASRRFGLEFGRCGVCGRGLTNDLSRELGIGPVCRERI
jgi:Family of unknown function (DUF6011)